MEIKKNKHYKLQIKVHGRHLDYEGEVIDVDNSKFYLRTDEDCKLEFELNNLISKKELPTPKKEIPTIVVRKKRVPKHLLKKQIEPEF